MPDAPSEPGFYVGYLPLPPGHRSFLLRLLPALAVVLLGAGALVALNQRDPGPALWEDGTPVTRDGLLLAEPYPMLLPADGGMPIFLVEVGKIGAQARAAPKAGRLIRVTGWRLSREGREILELVPGDEALAEIAGVPPLAPAPTLAGPLTIEGEIVDTKCYLGAMKPGDGKTHKACATLCVRNGIPPVLITHDAAGAVQWRLLVSETGGPLGEWILPYVGEPVRLQGAAAQAGPLAFLRLAPGGITRP